MIAVLRHRGVDIADIPTPSGAVVATTTTVLIEDSRRWTVPAGSLGQRVAGYTVIDLSGTFGVRRSRVSLTAEVQDLFDHAHRETDGGAVLGRLAILRARLEF